MVEQDAVVQDTAPDTPAEEAKWYADDEFTEEQLSVVNRYKDRAAFNKAFFEQRKTISTHATPPDASKLKPEEYAAKLKEYRAKAGGITDPEAFKIAWPSDIAGYIEGKDPELTSKIAANAAKFGLTQGELDVEIAERANQIRARMADEAAEATAAKQARDTAVADAAKALSDLWGDAVEQNTNNATLEIAKYDQTLFARDNESLSEQEIADRGGKLAQFVRELPPDKRNMVLRLFNNMYIRDSAESGPMHTTEGKGDNLYNDRYAKAKAMWPNRGAEWWSEAARSGMTL